MAPRIFCPPITTPGDLPPMDNAHWNSYWSKPPNLSYRRHAWTSLHWGYHRLNNNFTIPGVHSAWFQSNQHSYFSQVIPDATNKVEIGIIVWSGNFIALDWLLKCIHQAYLSPSNIPGA